MCNFVPFLTATSYNHIWPITTKASAENNMSALRPLNSQNTNLLLYLSPFCFPFHCLHYNCLTASSYRTLVEVGVWFSGSLHVSWVYFYRKGTCCHNNTDSSLTNSVRLLWMFSCSSWDQPLVSGCTARWCTFFFFYIYTPQVL